MGVCVVGSEVIGLRRRVLTPLEVLQHLRSPCRPLSGLVLDVGGVLYDDSAWHRWLFQLVSRMGLQTHYTRFFRVWRREYLELVKLGRTGYWEALRKFLLASGLTHGQIDEIEAAGRARHDAFEQEIHPLPGVVNTLTFLAEREVQLTALNSGCLELAEVRARLRRLGVLEQFHAVISMAELLARTPQADGFQCAIQTTGLRSDQLAYVGCDRAALSCAAGAGLRTVAFNYDEDAVADTYLDRFDLLPETLPLEVDQRAAG